MLWLIADPLNDASLLWIVRHSTTRTLLPRIQLPSVYKNVFLTNSADKVDHCRVPTSRRPEACKIIMMISAHRGQLFVIYGEHATICVLQRHSPIFHPSDGL